MVTLPEVKAVVGDLPWMSLGQAEYARRHIGTHGLKRILELGHMHGVSTCYLASIAAELGGHVTSLDLPAAYNRTPNAETLLDQCGLSSRVTLRRDIEGGEWTMMHMLEDGEQFDFVYIDAAHSWAGAGFMFFLADRLLPPGGWLLFDDLLYTIDTSINRDAPWNQKMTPAQRETPQVGKVWELLVQPHPGYDRFIEHGNWGLARKRMGSGGVEPHP